MPLGSCQDPCIVLSSLDRNVPILIQLEVSLFLFLSFCFSLLVLSLVLLVVGLGLRSPSTSASAPGNESPSFHRPSRTPSPCSSPARGVSHPECRTAVNFSST